MERSQRRLSLIRSFNNLTRDVRLESLDEAEPGGQSFLCELTSLCSQLNTELLPPADVVLRHIFSINAILAIRVLVELKVFQIISTPPVSDNRDNTTLSSWTYTSARLSELTGAEELLLVRFLRCAEALHYVDVPAPNTYAPNAVTFEFGEPSMAAGVSLVYDSAARPNSTLSTFLEYFKSEGYKCPSDPRDSPFQRANNTVGRTTFDVWFDNGSPPGSRPGEHERFNMFMHKIRGGRRMWFDWWDVKGQILADFNARDEPAAADVLLVDLGAGHGQDVLAFKDRFHDQAGSLVISDLPIVVDQIDKTTLPPQVQVLPQDLFQPLRKELQGAKVYFMHMIMHDWADEDSIAILKNIREAMKPGYSRILINDIVLPTRGASILQASFDVTMMSHHSACERDRSMWTSLVAGVEGLEIVDMWEEPGGEGIVEIVRQN